MSIKVKLSFCSFWEVKLGPIDPIFGYALLQIIISIFYFGTQTCFLQNFGERGMSSSMPKISDLGLQTATVSIL
jgi:hypothetical protein